METKSSITYTLNTNLMQYRYLCHEITKTQQMYDVLWKQKQRCQQSIHIEQMVKGYAKHYLPLLTFREIQHMVISLQHNSYPYQCKGIIERHFHWRGIDLYPMLYIPYTWMRTPLKKAVYIEESMIFKRQRVLYLQLKFDNKKNSMV